MFAPTGGAQPVITSLPVSQAVVWGGNATFSVTATDIGPLTYQWQLNGTNLPNNIITTVAGGNLFDHQPATNTILNGPFGAVVDSAGDLYIADAINNVIRRVDTNGMATIVAGNGTGSYSGDGGAATKAGLCYPHSVCVDSRGNLFIADSSNNRIRKVDTNGVITTVAGTGTMGSTGNGGAATNALLDIPYGVCVDGIGNLFISDYWNNMIRKVDTNGIINKYSAISFSFPTGLAVDSSNTLYIASGSQIFKVQSNGAGSIVAGTFQVRGYAGDGGLATSAKLNYPYGVAVDAAHNVYIADTFNSCIRMVGTNGIITTVAGNSTNGLSGDGGLASNANLSLPNGVAVDRLGNLIIIDSGNNRIRQVGTNGIIKSVVGRNPNDGDMGTNATLNGAVGVSFDSYGNMFIADTSNNRIRKVDTNGVITTVAGNGAASFSGDGGPATNASLHTPVDVAVDMAGDIYIADERNLRVRKVDINGIISTVAGIGSFSGSQLYSGIATNARVGNITGVAVDSSGNFYFSDFDAGAAYKVDTNGNLMLATYYPNTHPMAMDLDSGDDIFMPTANNQVLKGYPDSYLDIRFVAGNGTVGFSGDGGPATSAALYTPEGVAVDTTGNLFISDTYNGRIRKVNTNGIINTIAGNGLVGFTGDGGPGGSASFSLTSFGGGLAVDGSGNVYIADTGNTASASSRTWIMQTNRHSPSPISRPPP